MGISHDHGLELNNGYVVIFSPFKLFKNISKNIMRGSLSFKSHSQVNEYEVMTLGQHDPIFCKLRILNLKCN